MDPVAVRLTWQEQAAFAKAFNQVSSLRLLKTMMDGGCDEADAWTVIQVCIKIHRKIMDSSHSESVTPGCTANIAS